MMNEEIKELIGDAIPIAIGSSEATSSWYSPSEVEFFPIDSNPDDIPEDVIEISAEEMLSFQHSLDTFTELYTNEDGRPAVRQTTKKTQDEFIKVVRDVMDSHYSIELSKPKPIQGYLIPISNDELMKFASFLAAAQYTMDEYLDYNNGGQWVKIPLETVKAIVVDIRKWQKALSGEHQRQYALFDQHVKDSQGIFRLILKFDYQPAWPTELVTDEVPSTSKKKVK